MPTYEYECPKCGVFERFQSMKEERLKSCPTCRSRRVKRLLGRGAGIIFKGSGFYQTDYCKTKPPPESASGGASAPKKDAKAASNAAPSSSSPAASPGKRSPEAAKPKAKTD